MRVFALGFACLALLVGCSVEPSPPKRASPGPVTATTSPGVRVPAGIAALPDRGEFLAYYGDAGESVRRGAYTWHPVRLSEEHAIRAVVDGELVVADPAGRSIRLKYERHVEHPDGNWTWIGRVVGSPPGTEAIITFGEKAVFGSIPQVHGRQLRLSTFDGRTWLMSSDASLLSGNLPRTPDAFLPPRSRAGRLPAPREAIQTGMVQSALAGTVTVNLLLGYTNGFTARFGGQSQAVTRLTFLVDVANQAYVASNVDAQVRLVRAMQVSYPDATENAQALYQLSGFDCTTTPCTEVEIPPALQALHAARDQHGADLVSLVRNFDPTNDGCGVAWLIGGGLVSIDSSDEFAGMSVVSDNASSCRDETLAHELGHNMGAAHDRDTADGDDNILQNGEYGRFVYSFGFRSSTANFHTIMAYPAYPAQPIVRKFSNPAISCSASVPCGVANEADVARTLRDTMPVISTFRADATGSYRRNDVNADARSDLLFHNAATRQFSYRLMDGTTILDSFLVNGVGGGYTVAATGDFNGDGRADVVWTSAKLDIYLWLANGSGFTSIAVGTYPSGWKIVGAGDVDGDSKWDLLFHNANTRQFSYRIMDGATTVRAAVIGGVGPGYAVAAIGDFSGDGMVDVAWTSSLRDIYIWLGNGAGFSSVKAGTYPPGWKMAGTGNVDGDGKFDLLFHNPTTRQFSYRIMNGAVTVRAALFGGVGNGYAVAMIGDMNGDGKADIAWTSSQRDIYLWLGDGTGFTSVLAGDYPSGWVLIK